MDSKKVKGSSATTANAGKSTRDSHIHKDENPEGQTVIFKYYSVHSSAKTNRHIFIIQPSKAELLKKIKISVTRGPPSAKQVFEVYYYDEILPFLKKSGQQSIRGKKDLSNVWHIQTKAFKSFYEERAKILTTEWQRLSKEMKKMKKSKERNGGTTPRLVKKLSLSSNKIMRHDKKMSKCKKLDVRLIRTLLNFSLFFECTLKANCAMIMVSDQKTKYAQYHEFEQKIQSNLNINALLGLHLRIFIGQFDNACLRLHTSAKMIKLCFVMQHIDKQSTKIKELTLFELAYDKLCKGMADRIDVKRIDAKIERDDAHILTVHIPMMIDNLAKVVAS